ncbi:TonB2 energy transduction system inner membrane component ExbB [Halarcobacter ebronensis]|uniref:TonB2 energy transduction system inner membrane component ExbB n=1 Tax=Halarcobacter ebronensis TaxID=1462615 RepID=A0A4Q0YFC3_9BACT|nr:MotA/TolQ/ExbB proton channel family protein [Halarcobacter ebronensis]QKF81000.1 TonB system transport protein ExbB [Halarcobacter ebronensis]RXJ68903.1 TonB2 energy transduction system inner membrane component ExbB [Halarcobacter ebronensis]RXK06314.1 TonB2 energy transduction system inner membrane component ExbB [Halarcobacter ebronensis]
MLGLIFDDFSSFFDKGGVVLYVVFIVAIFLWTLLLDRYIYLYHGYKKYKDTLLANIKIENFESRFKDPIKEYLVEESKQKLNYGLSFIKTLIIVCPLIGLLGTVTGMIEVFDVMAVQGTSDVKSMANGVSMATIPTMAGMVIALSGILFEKRLELAIKYQIEKLHIDISKVM